MGRKADFCILVFIRQSVKAVFFSKLTVPRHFLLRKESDTVCYKEASALKLYYIFLI